MVLNKMAYAVNHEVLSKIGRSLELYSLVRTRRDVGILKID